MQAPAGIALLKGPDLVYQMANPTFLEIVGRTSDIVGKPGREVFPEAVAQGIWDLMEGVYRSGEPYVGKEFKALLDLKGTGELTTQYYDFVFQPVKDDQQQAEALLVTALDVTHQVEARKLVEENALRLQTLLESIPQMAWSATAEGELAYFNTQWYAYTGQTQAQALGTGWTEGHPSGGRSPDSSLLAARPGNGDALPGRVPVPEGQ
jgi:PAS domain-containing protein